ncbi:hypothetical protein FKR81_18875 [Lentzea tibetensis]|uniref:Ricin B lectin domain-containing protein n=1 Tax=Lentzea tibetensis TaxID=2591470 RepID=A0A563ESN0_9PSEU|nr:RICIN domain-containing protein [Lentzea tibetensis]TWP50676.1 hypothetical protein FKR81_18875 [Lentzea tibetensis]
MRKILAALAAAAISLVGVTAGATSDASAAAASFQLIARHSGKCLSPAVGATGDGVAVIQVSCDGTANQRWYTNPVAPGVYEVRNAVSNRCLDLYGWVNADAVATIMWSCHGGTNQQWQITPNSAGFNEFRSRATGRCVDVAHGTPHDGTPVYQWGCHGGGNQQFRFS